MTISRGSLLGAMTVVVLTAGTSGWLCAGEIWDATVPEQRHVAIRAPSQFRRVPLPDVPAPLTVASRDAVRAPENLSLDEALRVALANSQVIRVLAGQGATASGSTIVDPAIENTQIDVARGVFDPILHANNRFSHLETPQAIYDSTVAHQFRISGGRNDLYELDFGVTKRFANGATASVGLDVADQYTGTLETVPVAQQGLNPATNSTVAMSVTQPILKGFGVAANLAPIEIARINTERSFFQMKDNVQQMVRGVIEAYWLVVAARVDVWARQQQVSQGREALERAEAHLRTGGGNLGDVAQARTSLAGFQSSLIAAEADLLQREAALRNILGLPPTDQPHLVPVTPPRTSHYEVSWDETLRTAEQYRPDLIELKLILEADQQQLVRANNNALPQLDATARYQWDGYRGRTPDLYYIGTEAGQFTGWTVGIDFSVPLGLRAGRAELRQTELLIKRDRFNLDQGLHNAAHQLATNCRNLERYYEQYKMYREARQAAEVSLGFQMAAYRAGRTIYLMVLQSIIDWGNSVASEAGALSQYNAELANLDAQTGTILETHGIRFVEERYGSIGPLGRFFPDRCYPRDLQPGPNCPQYETTDKPSEDIFQLNKIRPGLLKPSVPSSAPPPASESVPSSSRP